MKKFTLSKMTVLTDLICTGLADSMVTSASGMLETSVGCGSGVDWIGAEARAVEMFRMEVIMEAVDLIDRQGTCRWLKIPYKCMVS